MAPPRCGSVGVGPSGSARGGDLGSAAVLLVPI